MTSPKAHNLCFIFKVQVITFSLISEHIGRYYEKCSTKYFHCIMASTLCILVCSSLVFIFIYQLKSDFLSYQR